VPRIKSRRRQCDRASPQPAQPCPELHAPDRTQARPDRDHNPSRQARPIGGRAVARSCRPKKNLIHHNNAARHKSRLAAVVRKLSK